MTIKKFMMVNRKAPYGTVYALESLEVVLIAAAFEQDVSLAFMDDGVYQLKKGHQTKGIEMKAFENLWRARGLRRHQALRRPGVAGRARPDRRRPVRAGGNHVARRSGQAHGGAGRAPVVLRETSC